MNNNLPEEIRGVLDDPKEDCGPFVTQIACLKVQLQLEKRLTTLENKLATLQLLNAGSIIAAIATLAGIAYVVWCFATGH